MKKCVYYLLLIFFLGSFAACGGRTGSGGEGDTESISGEETDGTEKVTTTGTGEAGEDGENSEDGGGSATENTETDEEDTDPEENTNPDDSGNSEEDEADPLKNYKLSGSVTGNRSDVVVTLDGSSQTITPNGSFTFTVQEGKNVSVSLFNPDSAQKCSIAIADFEVTSDQDNLNFQCSARYRLNEVMDNNDNAFTRCINENHGLQVFVDLIDYIDCENRNIDTLDGIEYFSELKTLSLAENLLASVDLTKNPKLENLDISKNKLSYIDLSKQSYLKKVDLSENELTNISLPVPNILMEMNVSNNRLTNLSFPTSSSLNHLDASFNQLSTIDIANAPNIEHLKLSNNQLTNLSLQFNSKLAHADFSHNNISNLDTSNSTKLYHLNLDGNTGLNMPDLSSNGELRELILPEHLRSSTWTIIGEVSGLGISDQLKVNIDNKELTLISNALFSVEVERDKVFTVEVIEAPNDFVCAISHPELLADKLFADLKIDCQPKITVEELLSRYDNNFVRCATEGIPIQEYVHNLTSIYCSGKSLETTEGLSHFIGLEYLELKNNKLKSIDLSYLYKLYALFIDNNEFETIDLTPLHQATALFMSHNDFLMLDFKNHPHLIHIDLTGNDKLNAVVNLPEKDNLTIIWPAHMAPTPIAPELSSIELYPKNARVLKGDTFQLTAVATFPDNSRKIVTNEPWLAWESNFDVLSVNGGKVNGNNIGGGSIKVSATTPTKTVSNTISMDCKGYGGVVAWDDSGKITDGSYDKVFAINRLHETTAAITTDGNVKTWGDASKGGDTSSVQSQLTDIKEVFIGYSAMAAIKADGSVITWPSNNFGGNSSSVQSQLNNVVSIAGASGSLAALKSDKSIVTWGNGSTSLSDSFKNQLTGIKSLHANDYAYAALKEDGSVITWGDSSYGGNSSSIQSQLTNVINITSNRYAFAALKEDGTVVTWGQSAYGGNSGTVQNQLTNITSITAVHEAFAALKEDGTVIAWGNSSYGGDLSAVEDKLTNVISITGNKSAFSALKEDGTVVSWGSSVSGGDYGYVAHLLKNVIKIEGSYFSFIAIKSDGSVVTWGHSTYGGEPDDIPSDATNVIKALGNMKEFAVITAADEP